jgi:pyruvate,water dikinase
MLRKYLLLSYYPDHLHQQILDQPYRPIKRRLFNLFLGLIKPSIIRWRIIRSYATFENNYKEYLRYFDQRIQKNNTFEELLKLDKELDRKFKPHWILSFAGGYHCIYAVSQLHYHLDQAYHDTSMVSILLSGISSRTNQVNQEIRQLALFLKNDPCFQKGFQGENISKISLTTTSKEFLKAFNEFLDKHGHRGYYRDVMYPTWQENPDILFKTIIALAIKEMNVTSKSEGIDFEEAIHKIEKIPKTNHRKILQWITLSRIFIKFREDERYFLDLHLSRKRKFYLKIAEKLHQKKLLEKEDDLFFLDIPTVISLINGTCTSISDKIKQTKNEYAAHQHQLPPKFLYTNKIKSDVSSIKTELSGIPASRGIITGKARVVLSLEDMDKIQSNDILVTRFTDPGWTSCFHLISGLVTEVGSSLSHGAIIAREYGIPAVTGVKDILKFISNGDHITVDGNTGIIIFTKK